MQLRVSYGGPTGMIGGVSVARRAHGKMMIDVPDAHKWPRQANRGKCRRSTLTRTETSMSAYPSGYHPTTPYENVLATDAPITRRKLEIAAMDLL